MTRHFPVFLFSFLVLIANKCLAKEEKGEVGERVGSEDSCFYAFPVALKKVIQFTKPLSWDPKCSWHFVGAATCDPVISCSNVKLKEGADCTEEYLKISDGVGGEQSFCGTSNVGPLIASKGNRDLFLEFSGSQRPESDWTCKIECNDPKMNAKHLAPTENEPKVDFRCVCGLRNEDDRIVGGEDAKKNEFPWLAAVVRTGTRSPTCGASVINDRFILTAAHCFAFVHAVPHEIEVLVHAHLLDMTIVKQDITSSKELGADGSIRARGWNNKNLTDEEDGAQRFEVAEIINHALFTDKYDYDVSLLRLKKKIPLNGANSVTPICLPPSGKFDETYNNMKATVAGWGLGDQNAGASTRLLQKLVVPTIDLADCRKMMPKYTLTQRMVCAGFKEGVKDACTGDSGGPLVRQKPNKQFEQFGIVSWGEGCAVENRPGVYSRVTELNQFIRYHAGRHTPTWCRDAKA